MTTNLISIALTGRSLSIFKVVKVMLEDPFLEQTVNPIKKRNVREYGIFWNLVKNLIKSTIGNICCKRKREALNDQSYKHVNANYTQAWSALFPSSDLHISHQIKKSKKIPTPKMPQLCLIHFQWHSSKSIFSK